MRQDPVDPEHIRPEEEVSEAQRTDEALARFQWWLILGVLAVRLLRHLNQDRTDSSE